MNRVWVGPRAVLEKKKNNLFYVPGFETRTVHSLVWSPHRHRCLPPPDGATARGGPWPPLQYASKSLGSLLYLSIFLRSMDTSSSHLILGLPLRLVAYSFPYIIFLWDCGVLHSFYMPKPSYSLAFNKPDNVLSLDYGF